MAKLAQLPFFLEVNQQLLEICDVDQGMLSQPLLLVVEIGFRDNLSTDHDITGCFQLENYFYYSKSFLYHTILLKKP